MPVGGGRLPHCGVTTLATRGCGSEFCWKPSRCVPGPHPWVTRCSPGQCGLPRWSSVQSPSSRHPIPERGQTPGRADAPATSCGRRGVLRPPLGCLALQRGLSPVFSCRRGSSDPPGGGIRGTASKSPRITPQGKAPAPHPARKWQSEERHRAREGAARSRLRTARAGPAPRRDPSAGSWFPRHRPPPSRSYEGHPRQQPAGDLDPGCRVAVCDSAEFPECDCRC